MQEQLTNFVKHPRDVVKEEWRCQASQNINTYDVLCAIDESVIESTRQAMMHQLVNFEAVNAL